MVTFLPAFYLLHEFKGTGEFGHISTLRREALLAHFRKTAL